MLLQSNCHQITNTNIPQPKKKMGFMSKCLYETTEAIITNKILKRPEIQHHHNSFFLLRGHFWFLIT